MKLQENQHSRFLDLDRSFSPSIMSADKKKVMLLFVNISFFFERLSAFATPNSVSILPNPKAWISSDSFQLKIRCSCNHIYDHSIIQLRSKLIPLTVPSHHSSLFSVCKGNNQCEMYQIQVWIPYIAWSWLGLICVHPSCLYIMSLPSVCFSHPYNWQNMRRLSFPWRAPLRSMKCQWTQQVDLNIISCRSAAGL